MKQAKDADAYCPFTGQLCKKEQCIAYTLQDGGICLLVKR